MEAFVYNYMGAKDSMAYVIYPATIVLTHLC